MNYLKNKRVYLSGPIQYLADTEWRTETKRILQREFELDLFDPFDDPKQQWVSQLKEAQKQGDYNTVVSIAKKFVRKDLSMVDRADLVIAYLPYKVPTTGTVHEIINSSNAKKPTLLIGDCNDINCIPVWYFGFISLEFIFPNWDKLFEYLQEVNDGKHRDNDRWSFIYGEI